MRTTIGVVAHVDAGKTTFCEALLHAAGELAAPGRVDHENTLLDHNALERQRGITIFSDTAPFAYAGRAFQLVDTPGHVDFCAEMERSLAVLDAAVLVLDGASGVQSHTLTLYRLLRRRGLPVYLFLNKMDLDTADTRRCLADVRNRLSPDVYLAAGAAELTDPVFVEWLCGYDDALLAGYLEGTLAPGDPVRCASRQIAQGALSLAVAGSALRGQGVCELLDLIAATCPPPQPTAGSFAAIAYRVLFDRRGHRVTLLKCLGGVLRVKDSIRCGDAVEKVHELRRYRGGDWVGIPEAYPGDIVGVTGLSSALPGMGVGACEAQPPPALQPALRVGVERGDAPHDAVMAALRRLEAQDPLLAVHYEPKTGQIDIRVMGGVQLEVLRGLLRDGSALDIGFGECRVVYQETVAEPVMGYGHFEPLRHYAEVHLRLEPNPGRGLAFASEVHTDILPRQHQNLVESALLHRDHKGVLTGSSLTDVRFVLTAGAFHLKHTEGGDLREAAWRAVRQGLEKAQSVLLEPWYALEIAVDPGALGRVLSDIPRLHGRFEPPQTAGALALIRAEGPVETFLEYPAELASFTGGAGSASMSFCGYRPCHDSERVIAAAGYERERDLENPSSSVFCAKGAGFEVKWHEAEARMHLPL